MSYIGGVSNLMTLGSAVIDIAKKTGSGIAKAFKTLFNISNKPFASNRNTESPDSRYIPLATSAGLKRGFVEVHNDKTGATANTYSAPYAEGDKQLAKANELTYRCEFSRYRDIYKTKFCELLDEIVKLKPAYRGKPLEQLTRSAQRLRNEWAFDIAVESHPIDDLAKDERPAFDQLYAVLLTRASGSSPSEPMSSGDFNILFDAVEKLAPEVRSGPLKNLGQAIPHLPHDQTFESLDRFMSACERIPVEHRDGLIGVYNAGLIRNRSAIHHWEESAVSDILKGIRESEAPDGIKQWQALVLRYGLTNVGKEEVRDVIVKEYANPAVLKGANVADILERYGLNDDRSRASVSHTALDSEEIVADLRTCLDYQNVATKYGIIDTGARAKMSEMADNYYRARQ